MLLHPEIWAIVARERMTTLLQETALDRLIRAAHAPNPPATGALSVSPSRSGARHARRAGRRTVAAMNVPHFKDY